LLAAASNGTEPTLSTQGICDDAFIPIGRAVIEKTLIGSGLVTATGQEIQWKITVTASGGNIKDFEIKDTLPDQLEYVNYTVVTSNDTTVSLRGIVGQIITWKVMGTLLQNQHIEIILTTRVIILPEQGEDIINVACVRDNI
jgi:fimbrial isopeptide formation D2 family protein